MTEPQWHTAQLNVGRLRREGTSPAAFTFRAPFEPGVDGPGDTLVEAEFCWPELAAS